MFLEVRVKELPLVGSLPLRPFRVSMRTTVKWQILLGFGWCCLVLFGVVWCCLVLFGVVWCCLV